MWNGFELIVQPSGGFVRADPSKKNLKVDPKDPVRRRCAVPTAATSPGRP